MSVFGFGGPDGAAAGRKAAYRIQDTGKRREVIAGGGGGE